MRDSLGSNQPSMAGQQLDSEDQGQIRRCLEFVISSSELEGEFATRIGADASEVADMLTRWPEPLSAPDGSSETVAINNALNEVVHGMHISAADERWLGASRGAIQALYFRWASSRGWSATGLR
jgi:hypothetical protein